MPPKKYDIAVAGQLCLDIIPQIPATGAKHISELLQPGKLLDVGAARISNGGLVANSGLALTKLGLKTVLIARIGRDDFGRQVQNILRQHGCSMGITVAEREHTSYSIAIAPPGIDRIFLHYQGANSRFTNADIDENILRQTNLFLFGYPPTLAKMYENEGEELVKIFRSVKSLGLTTALDLNLPDMNSPSGRAPWRKILTNILPYVDIFLPSIEEIFFMLAPAEYLKMKKKAGENDAVKFIPVSLYPDLASELLKFGAKVVGFKTGFRGFYVRTANLEESADFGNVPPADMKNWSERELWYPAYRIQRIVSATGSGDSAVAGFVAAFYRGHAIENCLKYANCLGFQNLHEIDGYSGIKEWRETTRMLGEGDLKLVDLPDLADERWRWDEELEMWVGKNDNFYYSGKER